MTTLTSALTFELFQRTRASAAIGTLGVVIMLYPHLSHVAAAYSWSWAATMVLLLAARFINSLRKAEGPSEERRDIHLCNVEATLCALVGLGWGSAIFVFDTQAMDPLFFLRFLILAAAMAFVVTSTAVMLRVGLAYTLTIGTTVMAFIVTHDYAQPRDALLFSVALYTVMVSALAVSTNRRVRRAVTNQLAVASLTEELTLSLKVERSLRDELSVLADTDELTGALNRRGVLTHLNAELARSRRFASPIAVLMIDIDRFKNINDTYGHAAGDTVIRRLAEIGRKELRETDILGRVGGEEFLVMLPMMDLEGAQAVAERIRECVQNLEIQLPDKSIQITISIGVAVYRHEDNADRIMARADDALYQAKHNGRNRVEVSA